MLRAAAFMLVAAARPSTVGAILPSSRHLADAMARAARGAEHLVELGAGTGAITEALCEQHPDVPTQAVEMDPLLAQHLREHLASAKDLTGRELPGPLPKVATNA